MRHRWIDQLLVWGMALGIVGFPTLYAGTTGKPLSVSDADFSRVGYPANEGWTLRLPSADEKAAMIGSAGGPSAANPFVTSDDTRLSSDGGGGILDEDGEIINPEVTTGSFIGNGPGAPLAGSCPHNKATYRDTTRPGDTYICYGVGQNWHLIGETDDSIVQLTMHGQTYAADGPTFLTIPTEHILSFGCQDAVGNTDLTMYLQFGYPGGACTNVESTAVGKFGRSPLQGVLTRLKCRYLTAMGAGNSAIFTLRLNSVDTTLTCTVTDPATACDTGTITYPYPTAFVGFTIEDVVNANFAGSPSVACSVTVRGVYP